MSVAEPTPRIWSVADYERAAAVGLFGPEERLELIEGEILTINPQNSPHATACDLVEEVLRRVFSGGYVIRTQKPLRLGDDSEPEPDVFVVRGNIRDFARSHPRSAVLVVEVADTSVEFDLGRKRTVYARNGIPEYWVLLIGSRVLVSHREPDAGGEYRRVVRLGPADCISPLAAKESIIAIAELLP